MSTSDILVLQYNFPVTWGLVVVSFDFLVVAVCYEPPCGCNPSGVIEIINEPARTMARLHDLVSFHATSSVADRNNDGIEDFG